MSLEGYVARPGADEHHGLADAPGLDAGGQHLATPTLRPLLALGPPDRILVRSRLLVAPRRPGCRATPGVATRPTSAWVAAADRWASTRTAPRARWWMAR